MARTDGWREISLAVHEDDLEGVPVVAGPLTLALGAFYEKLSQLHLMKYCMAQPRTHLVAVPLSYSSYFFFFHQIFFFIIFAHILSYFLTLIIIKSNISINYNLSQYFCDPK